MERVEGRVFQLKTSPQLAIGIPVLRFDVLVKGYVYNMGRNFGLVPAKLKFDDENRYNGVYGKIARGLIFLTRVVSAK